MSYRRKGKENDPNVQAREDLTAAQAEMMDAAVLKILTRRDGQRTHITLDDGRSVEIYDITYHYDLSHPFAVIYASESPRAEEKGFIAFSTEEVVRITDPETQAIWFDAESQNAN